ncbi:MAG: M60 family metallopeptidase [Kiritimatiellaeota bacterium]|nr:M60 family metallopeptidase [Kiritimatiellota bacterium]
MKASIRMGVLAVLFAAVCRGEDVRGVLLEGVGAIDSGGAPGAVLCGGEDAFALVVGKVDRSFLPVAVAARYGKGRVVAVGHPSFWSEEGCGKADTRAFARNAAGWVGQGRKTVRVFKNAGFANVLRQMGDFEVAELSDWGQLSGDVGVLVAYPDDIPAQEIERVRAFITGGGGMLASGIGWGWHQVSGGKSLVADNLFNRLLAPAGLLIDMSMPGRTDARGYLASGPVPEGVNIAEAAALAQGGVADKAVIAQVNTTLCAARSVLASGDKGKLAQAVDAVMRSADTGRVPSEKEPMREADIAARMAMIALCNEWQGNPLKPWKASAAAATYPGIVAKGAPRGRKTLDVNLDVPRWHSTGLFASAGEAVTVELPPGAEKLGLKLRVGSTTCNVTSHDKWVRAPKVDIEVPLKEAKTTVSTPFGGLLYVVVPDRVDASARTCKVTLGNACQAAWFKVGRDNAAAWKQMLRSPAPYGEIESGKVILTVPSAELQNVEDPVALMKYWDEVADLDARLTGIPTERRSPERFVCDAQLCAGWMHAGYPIMLPNVTAKELVNLAHLKTKGDWGFFHELGHNHQNGDWTFHGTGEVTVNFFTLYNMEKMCGLPPRQTRMKQDGLRQLPKWVANGKPHDEWCRDPFLALEMFVRIQQAYGWEAFEKLFAEYRTLRGNERPKNDMDKRDQWCTRLSRLTGENIAAVFDSWNVPISDTARQACAAFPMPTDKRMLLE